MEKINLSVITASFNSEKTIESTLNSILNQDCSNMEYIIVDGGSSDSTLSIIQKFENFFNDAGVVFKWISEKDTGIYNAWNKGLDLAKGDWISFLGSDDIYLPKAIQQYRKQMFKNPESDFITAKARIVSNGILEREFGTDWHWKSFKREMKILHAGGFINKNYILQYGKFDESYRIAGDYELLLRKGKKLNVIFINQFLVEMNADGVSNTLIQKALKEAMQARIKNNARSKFFAHIDYYWIFFKISCKKILHVK